MTAFASPAEFDPLDSYHEYPVAEPLQESATFR
jgi:rRNA maturation protein Nop10